MSQYIVSARKYRPDSFDSLIGQDNIARTLKNSIARDKVAHAYLFCGPRGVGKTSTARIFAKAINCLHPTDDLEPCGQCESCVSFAEGRSYCIHELDAASNNGVEDIKVLLEKVQIPPQVGRYSVYIIDEVHMLSTAAFNAFLKTLEEPPAHAVFILATTEKHKVLPTILSRCQTYDFNRISVSDIVANLRSIATKENVNIDDETLHIIAKKADGAMRDALTIFDQTVSFCGSDVRYEDVLKNLNVLDYEYTFKLVDSFIKGDYPSALLLFDEILAKGFNSLHFVMALSAHFRDLVVSKTSGLESLLDLPASLQEKYRQQSQDCSVKFLFDALSITTSCETGYKASVNPRLHIEFALMKLCFLNGMPSAQSIPVPSPAVQVPPITLSASHVSSAATPEVAETPKVPAIEESTSPVTPEPIPTAETEVHAVEAPAAPQAEPVSEPAAVVPEPATVVPEPAPAARPHRKIVSSASSLSLTNLMKEEDREKTDNEGIAEAKLPSDEEILSHWPELVAACQSRPRLANALSTAKLSITPEGEGKLLVFTVTNEAQRKWIADNLLRNLEGTFCKIIACGGLRMEVAAMEYVEEEKIYLPGEQAKDLMNKNEEVKNLVIDLDLDL